MKKTHLFIVLSVVGCMAIESAWGMQSEYLDALSESTKMLKTLCSKRKQVAISEPTLASIKNQFDGLTKQYNHQQKLRNKALEELLKAPEDKKHIKKKTVEKIRQKLNWIEQQSYFLFQQIELLQGYDKVYGAIRNNDSKTITSILNENKNIDVNAKSIIDELEGATFLHYASGIGKEKIVKTLLSLNANPNITDNNGDIPYDYASRNNNISIMKVLEEATV